MMLLVICIALGAETKTMVGAYRVYCTNKQINENYKRFDEYVRQNSLNTFIFFVNLCFIDYANSNYVGAYTAYAEAYAGKYNSDMTVQCEKFIYKDDYGSRQTTKESTSCPFRQY